jgi:hypothetical protein
VKSRKRWISIPWLLYGYCVVIIWLLYGWWDILRYCSIPRNRWDIDGNIMGIYWGIYGILMGYYWLVGGIPTPLKNMSSSVGLKINSQHGKS